VRVNCPIFIDDQILKIASKKTKETKTSEKTAQNPYAAMSTAELQAELDMYLENEEYDKAIPIRDEINRRNNQ
jgi:protein-arginine kinase activator protein McsA